MFSHAPPLLQKQKKNRRPVTPPVPSDLLSRSAPSPCPRACAAYSADNFPGASARGTPGSTTTAACRRMPSRTRRSALQPSHSPASASTGTPGRTAPSGSPQTPPRSLRRHALSASSPNATPRFHHAPVSACRNSSVSTITFRYPAPSSARKISCWISGFRGVTAMMTASCTRSAGASSIA